MTDSENKIISTKLQKCLAKNLVIQIFNLRFVSRRGQKTTLHYMKPLIKTYRIYIFLGFVKIEALKTHFLHALEKKKNSQ